MDKFDLDTPIMQFMSPSGSGTWTIRHAVEGVQIFGGIGSGKSTGSGYNLIIRYLINDFGGLVLTVKPTEKEEWIEYCRLTGRISDLIVLEPNGKHHFNFLQYESTKGHSSYTENIVQVLKTVISAGEEKKGIGNNDAFWDNALDMLIFNVVDLCMLAYGRVSVQTMYDIVQTLPKSIDEVIKRKSQNESKAFDKAFDLARASVMQKINVWKSKLTLKQRNELQEQDYMDALPEARALKHVDEFFFENFIKLADRTQSIVLFSFSGFLFRLLREPIYSMFCRFDSNVTPEDCLNGKILLLNIPTKVYHKAGRDCQILFKYIWQRAMESRSIEQNNRPLFLWADEAQNFLHEHDADFQATARSSRISTVYISQNLPNYYANMGGQSSDNKVKSFLGTLNTKIFHANADIETNRYASEIIGDDLFEDTSTTFTVGQDLSTGQGKSYKWERIIRPEQFMRLKTGGSRSHNYVEAIIHRQGETFDNGFNHIRAIFYQNYQP